MKKLNESPELLLYANDEKCCCGGAFAWVDNGSVTLAHCCTDEAHRGKGLGKLLITEIENRSKTLGFQGITLGAVEGAEGFYEKCGYKGSLLIQSEINSIDELRS